MSQLPTRLRILIIAIGVCVALSPLLFNPLSRHTDEGSASPSNVLSLKAPPFMRGVEAASLFQNSDFDYGHFSEVAGIAAYIQVELTEAEKVGYLSTIEGTISGPKSTDQYVSGTIVAPGYEGFPQAEELAIQIYADTNGWIVAYLQNDQPASMIINWLQFKAKPIGLISAVEDIADAVDKLVNPDDVFLYDFSNSDATGIFIAGDKAETGLGEYSNTFKVTIPNNFSIKDVSWSHMVNRVTESSCLVEETNITFSQDIDQRNQRWVETGKIDSITNNDSYTIQMNESSYYRLERGPIYCGIVLIYGERGNR